MPNSVSLHRILKTSPEKVFRAFTQASAIASWLPPYGFTCTVHQMKAEAMEPLEEEDYIDLWE